MPPTATKPNPKSINYHVSVAIGGSNLFTRTKEVIAREREINLEIVLLIAALERSNAAVNLWMWGGKKELAQKLGLTFDQYLKRAQAGRVLWRHPEFIDLIRSGKTYVSHVGMLAAKITGSNKEIFLREIGGKSEREVRALIASVNRDGSRKKEELTFDLKLTFTQSQLETLERAREVLSACGAPPSDEEALIQALEDLLDKRDPMRLAKRAEQRAAKKADNAAKYGVCAAAKHGIVEIVAIETDDINVGLPPTATGLHASKHEGPRLRDDANYSDSINSHAAKHNGREALAAAVKHEVYIRDQGCCSFVINGGRRCGSAVGIQYDHVIPIAHGGSNDLGNIRLLCREHNLMEAMIKIGAETMSMFLYQ